MPFDWYHYSPPDFFTEEIPAKGEAQVADRIREQARILRNLGYDQKAAVARVRVDLNWEWEIPRGKAVPCWDRIEALVEETYAMGVRESECAFPDPEKVHNDIREVYEKKALDAGAC